MNIVPISLEKLLINFSDSWIWCLLACNNKEPLEESLSYFRSEELKKFAKNVFPNESGTHYTEEMRRNFSFFQQQRKNLMRNKLLKHSISYEVDEVIEELNRPRSMLAVYWELSIFDGGAIPITMGYLDWDYIPPSDYWLEIYKDDEKKPFLLSWVPEWLSEDINTAMEIDMGYCMAWAYFDKDRLVVKEKDEVWD